jgi:hypothetical protein
MSRSTPLQQRIRESKIAKDNMRATILISPPALEVISNIRSEPNTEPEPITPSEVQDVPNPLEPVDIKKKKKNIATHYVDYKAVSRMWAIERSMKEDKHAKAELSKSEKRKKKVESKSELDTKRILRYRRQQFIGHAGGMMEMAGLLRYTFSDIEDIDNVQDNLRANLLVGALLELGDILYKKDTEEIAALVARGSQFRNTATDKRMISPVNPLLSIHESLLTSSEIQSLLFAKNREAAKQK